MPRSIVGGKAFSLRRTPSRQGLRTFLVLLAGVCLAMQAAMQYMAWSLDFQRSAKGRSRRERT